VFTCCIPQRSLRPAFDRVRSKAECWGSHCVIAGRTVHDLVESGKRKITSWTESETVFNLKSIDAVHLEADIST
jgi:hypothetical protein